MIELPEVTFELYLKSDLAEIIEKDGKYYFEDEEIEIMKDEKEKTYE